MGRQELGEPIIILFAIQGPFQSRLFCFYEDLTLVDIDD
jgi:hypothetical protein